MARTKCPHCEMTPCMGGKGPGSCMGGNKGKTVPSPRSRKEQDADRARGTHVSDWRKIGGITKNGQTINSYSCRSCGVMKVAFGQNEPPDEIHKDRR